MNINEHDKKEIKGCMKLLETIKDTSRDYVGTNGCLYQDITREELDLIVNEIERLNNELQDFKVQDISNQEQLYNLIEENERLNNIINELEEWLDSFVNDLLDTIKYNNDEYWEIIHQEKYEDRVDILNLVLDKLKELKENK